MPRNIVKLFKAKKFPTADSLVSAIKSDLETYSHFDDSGNNILHYMARSGYEYVIQNILMPYKNPDFINKLNNEGLTPISIAVLHDKPTTAILLIDSFDADIFERGRFAHSAAYYMLQNKRMKPFIMKKLLKDDDAVQRYYEELVSFGNEEEIDAFFRSFKPDDRIRIDHLTTDTLDSEGIDSEAGLIGLSQASPADDD